MSNIPDYGKIYNLGHRAIDGLLEGPVLVEEKVDGSQFSMMVDTDGQLHCRSKRAELILDAPQKMFQKAIDTAQELAPLLQPGVVYRCEYLQKPKHNTLAYDRVPSKFLVLLDMMAAGQNYFTYEDKVAEATKLGIDITPKLYEGVLDKVELLEQMLDRVSLLGGQKIEGVVIKNYNRFGVDGKVLMGKHVSEAFKEVHRGWNKEHNPSKGDVVDILCEKYRSEARWNKAIQHLEEEGQIENSPRDIGAIIKEAQSDLVAECEDEIKEALWKWAKPQITRRSIRGLPEWYKNKLMKDSFGETPP